MFYIRIVSVSFWRQRARTLLHLMIYTATVIFLGIYTGNLEGNRSQLQHLAEKVPVEATVINLSGGRESGLFIKESLFDGVMNSKHVQDPLFTLQLTAADKEQDFTILAMTSLNGYEKLFCTSEKACVITSELSESLKLKEGDTMTLDLQYYKLDTDTHLSWQILPLERVSYKIAGITDTDTAPAEIMIPMETARDSYLNQGVRFFVSSGSFRVKDPLKLNAFKREMDAIGFLEVIPQAQSALEGYSLTVKDETFIRASKSISKGYRTMRLFFPAICAGLAGAGIVTAYLLGAGRQEEYRLRRLLGMPHTDCLAVYLAEQGVTELIGGMTGGILSVLATGTSIRLAAVCFGIFFFFFFAGSIFTLKIFKKTMLFKEAII